MQTYEEVCDFSRNCNFTLPQMHVALQYIVDKIEHAHLVMRECTNVKSVGAKSQQHNQKDGQSACAYCSSDHKAIDCAKYKTINASKDRVVAQHLCFNCLSSGHSSKACKSMQTCHICHFHHHTLLCNQRSSSKSSDSSSSSSNSKGQSSQPRSSSSSSSNAQTLLHSHQHPMQQQQQQKPVVTQGKSNTISKTPSSSGQQTSVTNVNLAQTSSKISNVFPTATLNLCSFHQKINTQAFFDIGSQRSFVSPDILRRLNLPVVGKVPIQLTTFGDSLTSCLLDLVKVKVQFGISRFTIKLLVHDQASMELNCPGIYEVIQQLADQGYQLAYHYITSDALTGIKVLIGVDCFSCFMSCQKRARIMNLFVTRDRGVIPFRPLPKWISE